MATTRAGDPTATQSPSAPPTPGAVPTESLPADGDACNAASIAQALKVNADFAAWLMSPRGQAAAGTGASNWAEAIRQYKNARLQTRFAVDHLGFPAGKFVQWQEDWSGSSSPSSAAFASAALTGRWLYSHEFSGIVTTTLDVEPSDSTLRAAFLAMRINTSTDLVRAFTRTTPVAADADTSMVMQWDCCPNSGTLANTEHAAGLVQASYVTGGTSSAFSADEPNGVAFVRRAADANWKIYTKNGGSAAYADTGVAAALTTPVRFRIETVGANVGDDSTARALFYVNGVFKASVPVATISTPRPMFSVSNPGGGAARFDIGVVDFRANIWPGNVLF